LHTVGAIESLSTDPRFRERDGLVIVNPDPTNELVVVVSEVFLGDEDPFARDNPLHLDPGDARTVELPRVDHTGTTERRRGGMLRLAGSHPFVLTAYQPLRAFEGNDSQLVLPDDALGRTYVVASYPPHPAQFQGAGSPSFFEVIALADDTDVRYRPRQATAGAGDLIAPVAAGQWSPTVSLRRHESLRLAGANPSETQPWRGDVSGTVVEASKPVAVIGGTRCASVPPSSDALAGCDPLSEQLVPVARWSSHVAVPHPPLRTSEAHFVRIYAGVDGVRVSTEPPVTAVQPILLAERGEYLDIEVAHGVSFVVDADGPVLAVGYLTTRDRTHEIGDPSMYQFVATDRFLSRYVVATAPGWSTHLLQIVRPVEAAEVFVDAEIVDAWERFEDYETAVVTVSEGPHVVASDGPFGLTQFGWTNEVRDSCIPYGLGGECQTSYAHVAGMRWR
jgi:hypothetical protein